jgi:4-nitrophenyl phosphatase
MTGFQTSHIKALILDMDGVLWKEYHPLVDLPAAFEIIRDQGWRVQLASNNSTRTPVHYLEKIAGFGVDLQPWQVVNSSLVTAAYLKDKHPEGGPVHIVGEEGLHQALSEAGFWPDPSNNAPLAVAAGMDRELTYEKIERAARLIRQGKPFLGTNPDKTFPTPRGLAPGAGVVLAALEAASGTPPQIMGKPASPMFQLALQNLGTTPQETLMVGDRVETDILGAREAGIHTALVLTGVTSEYDARQANPAPDLVAPDLMDVLDRLKQESG